ncbi:hypothetical protein AAE478_010334 [Parahypoxylon ruwenzoriense]
MSSTPKGFQCTFPGCDKAFNRKEHLNRHTKSHDPQLQYKCLICGRRYARSDVLRRHVKHHPQAIQPSRDHITCAPCRDRNSKCDGNSPCGSCVQNLTNCNWIDAEAHESNVVVRDIDSNNGTGINITNENEFSLPDGVGVTEQASVVLSVGHVQEAWFSSDQNVWSSRPCPGAPPGTSNPTDFNSEYQMQDSLDPISYLPPSLSSVTIDDSPGTSSNNNANGVETSSRDPSNRVHKPPQSASPSTTQQQTTFSSPESGSAVDLHTIFDRGSPTTTRLIDLFFSEIHQYWPILHAPTFERESSPTILLASMVMLASWLESGPEHQKLASVVLDEVARAQMVRDLDFTEHLTTADGMVPRALNLTALLISTCRYLGIFNGQYTFPEKGDGSCDCPFAAWRAQEELNRLAFSVLRVDAYLSVLLDHPPSVRYQELCIPLPKSNQLWSASNEEERRRLQWNEPGGREKALFSFFMRDALDSNRVGRLPYCLTDIDYHLSTCATQAGLWEAAREAHSSMSDELVEETDPSTWVQLAHPQVTLWRDRQRQDCEIRYLYALGGLSGSEYLLTPLTFTLMHVSTLKLYAPLNTLRIRGYYYKSRPGSSIPTRKPRAHLRNWITSGCPRTALWNAAQICRVYEISSQTCSSDGSSHRAGLLLNPLLTPGVLMSAVVACSFAFYTRACQDCTGAGNSAPGVVDLFHIAHDDDPVLLRWTRDGVGVPMWGNQIPVCKCRLSDLAAWFREAFAQDKGAEMELVLFLAELSRES